LIGLNVYKINILIDVFETVSLVLYPSDKQYFFLMITN